MKSKPLVVELYAGRFGWGRGFVAEGWRSIGFDILHEPYHGPVPEGCELVLQDVMTLNGRQFRGVASMIVASPPCQRYSYMAMPWKRAKREGRWQRWERDSPFGDRLESLNALFNAALRIAREAELPIVIENVKGAQPWVGRAKANFGSYYLWGDVARIGNRVVRDCKPVFGMPAVQAAGRRQKFNPDGTEHGVGSWFAVANSKNRGASVKVASESGRRTDPGLGARFTSRDCGVEAALAQSVNPPDESTKLGGSWFHGYRKGQGPRNHGIGSSARKAASAMIAEIPFELAAHVARVFRP